MDQIRGKSEILPLDQNLKGLGDNPGFGAFRR